MGLLDILNGMQNGPRGPSTPSQDEGKSEGMSPITMAILGLIAYKAFKHLTAGQPTPAPGSGHTAPPQLPTGTTTANADTGGGLGGLLKGGLGGGLGGSLGGTLGGLLAGGAAGSILSGGLNDLLKQLQDKGQGDAANSWVSNDSPNKSIEPGDLANALGADQIQLLSQQTGLSSNELLAGLAQQLPDFINKLTPDGKVPDERELSRWL